VQSPDPSYEYFVDYAVFHGDGPQDFEQLSDDFDIPGYEGTDQKWFQEGNAVTETFSHRGYLTVTLMGMNGMWGMAPALSAEMPGGLGYVDVRKFKPPWEIETSFVAPDNGTPWNLYMFFTLFDENRVGHLWTPGLQNFPKEGVKYINYFVDPNTQTGANRNEEDFMKDFNINARHSINVVFEKELPQSLLAHKPLFMVVQLIDDSHVRVGFKANRTDTWIFSKPFDTAPVFGKIANIQLPEFVSVQGNQGEKGWGAGNYPYFQQFLFDYVHLRYGALTTSTSIH
jgi:hypothetical protein